MTEPFKIICPRCFRSDVIIKANSTRYAGPQSHPKFVYNSTILVVLECTSCGYKHTNVRYGVDAKRHVDVEEVEEVI